MVVKPTDRHALQKTLAADAAILSADSSMPMADRAADQDDVLSAL